jgi:hypothetical protein
MDGPKDQRVPGQPGAAAVCELWEEQAHDGPDFPKTRNGRSVGGAPPGVPAQIDRIMRARRTTVLKAWICA